MAGETHSTTQAAPLISTNEAETVIDEKIDAVQVNTEKVQKLMTYTIIAVAGLLLLFTLAALFNNGSNLHDVFFTKTATTTLQFK